MPELVLHSRALSLYLRIATLVCEEKKVDYRVEPCDEIGKGFRKFHPFQKMPVLQHGEHFVFETLAIANYVDQAFDGPQLSPSTVRARSEMLTWISLANAYFFPTMMGGVVKPLLLAPLLGEPVDRKLVAASIPALNEQVALLEERLAYHQYLAGEDLSLADLFVYPNVAYASLTDEGQAALTSAPYVQTWLGGLMERPSFAATEQRL